METILFEGTLFGRVGLKAVIPDQTRSVVLHVDGEGETKHYEWGNLNRSNNRSELHHTLASIAARWLAREIRRFPEREEALRQEDGYLLLQAFLNAERLKQEKDA